MRVLIVEDLPPVAKSLERLVRARLGDRLERIDRVPDVAAAEAYLHRHAIDLLLLDLNLGGSDGFEILGWATAGGFHTVVVSANVHRAFEAFEHGVLDFVGKPVDPERLARALTRVAERERGGGPGARRLGVRRRDGVEMVATDAIRFIRGAGKYSELHLAAGRRMLHEKSLERLAAILPEPFVRVHRSYIVNLRRVRRLRVERGGRYALELGDGDEVPVGRGRYRALRERLESAASRSRATQRSPSTP